MDQIQEVRRQQNLRNYEQRRLEHSKEMNRRREHGRQAHVGASAVAWLPDETLSPAGEAQATGKEETHDE